MCGKRDSRLLTGDLWIMTGLGREFIETKFVELELELDSLGAH